MSAEGCKGCPLTRLVKTDGGVICVAGYSEEKYPVAQYQKTELPACTNYSAKYAAILQKMFN